MGVVGFEPTKTEVSGFTVRRNWPLCDTPVSRLLAVGLEPTTP